MDKAHDVKIISFQGTLMRIQVDGKEHEIDLARHSPRIAAASQAQRERFELSPVGYGIHWPELDEDLSIDGLIGIEHSSPLSRTRT